MDKFITTSDGKIGFRQEDYLQHSVNNNKHFTLNNFPELVLWTKTTTGGRIYKFDTYEEAVKAGKEITDQLSTN